MPRVRSQLALQLPPELIERVRAAAAVQRRTITAIVADWIEAGLAGAAGPAGDPSGLADRLAAVEARLLTLEQSAVPRSRPPRSLDRVTPAIPQPSQPDPSATDRTTAELADALGVKRSSLNERLRRQGGAREGLLLPEGWLCTGQARSARGGPPRWLWRRSA